MKPDAAPSLRIWHVLALALGLRVMLPISAYFYTGDLTIFYTGDSAQYIVPASQLIAHHRFFSDGSLQARVWNSPVAPAPEIIRTPGYPLLLVAGLLIGRVALVTISLQILLNSFTVYMVYRTAELLFESQQLAIIAAMFYAMEPLGVLFSSLLSTEAMFTTITAVGVYYLVSYLRQQSLRYLIVSACSFAISAYVRPVGYYLPMTIFAGLGAWMLIANYQKKARLSAHLAIFMIASLAVTGFWRIRNEIVTGYSGFSSVFSDDMYCNMAASVLATKRRLSYNEIQQRLGCYDLSIYFKDHPKQKAQPIGQILKHERDQAMTIFLRNPVIFFRVYLEGVIRGVFDPLSTEFVRLFDFYPKQGGLLETEVDNGIIKTVKLLAFERPLALSTAVLLTVHLIYILGMCAAVIKGPTGDPAFLSVLLTMSYYLVLPGGPSDWGRYRHPAMPMMCVLSGYGLSAVWNEISRRTAVRTLKLSVGGRMEQSSSASQS